MVIQLPDEILMRRWSTKSARLGIWKSPSFFFFCVSLSIFFLSILLGEEGLFLFLLSSSCLPVRVYLTQQKLVKMRKIGWNVKGSGSYKTRMSEWSIATISRKIPTWQQFFFFFFFSSFSCSCLTLGNWGSGSVFLRYENHRREARRTGETGPDARPVVLRPWSIPCLGGISVFLSTFLLSMTHEASIT